MTYDQFERKVRLLVNDAEEGTYRFSQETVFDCIREAVKHLRVLQPTEQYGADGLLDKSPLAVGAGVEIRINDEKHVEAVVKYAAHLIYELDMSDTVNLQLSENLKARAEVLMQL